MSSACILGLGWNQICPLLCSCVVENFKNYRAPVKMEAAVCPSICPMSGSQSVHFRGNSMLKVKPTGHCACMVTTGNQNVHASEKQIISILKTKQVAANCE